MNDNSLLKLLADVEPKIQDIEENRIEVKALKDVLTTLNELVNGGNMSYDEILDFYDQDFIFKAIKIGNVDSDTLINKYKSSKYLLKNKDSKIKELPQYKESMNYIDSLYQYLYGLCQKIKIEYENKVEKLNIKEILNKYYLLLNKENIFIKNINEFIVFLDLNNLSASERLDILILINKNNIKNYVISNDIEISNDIKLSDIKKIINDNNELLNQSYDIDETSVDKILINNKENISLNVLLNKKIYLINKINKLYNEKKYTDIISDYREFVKIIDIEKEFSKQQVKNNKLVFLKKDNKSLIREYLDKAEINYKNCIYKNLLDIEKNEMLEIPEKMYKKIYLYLKNDFIVKTVYTYLDNGSILILGVLDKNETIDNFIQKNSSLLDETFKDINKKEFDSSERDIILNNIKLDELVLNIDLDTLDVKMEEENAR